MSELLEIQRRVAAAILHPLTKTEAMPRRRREGVSNVREAEALIRPNDRLTSFERLEIYNRQYWFRLYSALEEDFPGLKAVVGSAKFERITRDYLTDCPSTSFTLRNLGSRLVEWLVSHPDHIAPRGVLALDIARLEWAHIEAFDSAAEDPLDPDDGFTLTDNSRLNLQPHLRVLELHYPVDDLLIALHSNYGTADFSSNNASATRKTKQVRRVAMLEQEQIHLAVHRQQNSVYYKRLTREDFLLLRALIAGETISSAIQLAFENSSISAEQRGDFLREAFASWSAMGWFTRPHSI